MPLRSAVVVVGRLLRPNPTLRLPNRCLLRSLALRFATWLHREAVEEPGPLLGTTLDAGRRSSLFSIKVSQLPSPDQLPLTGPTCGPVMDPSG